MNCRTVLIIVVVDLRVKITRRYSLEGANTAVCGQETTGTNWEAEARNRKLFADRDLGINAGNLFKVGL